MGADHLGTRKGLFVQPGEDQAAQRQWVSDYLHAVPEREKILPLTGKGRTTTAIAADIALISAGAKRALEGCSVAAIPEEVTQSANDSWVRENVAEGLIKMRGEGRTKDVVRRECTLYKLGTILVNFLAQPEANRAAQRDFVQSYLADVPDREKVLPLSGAGRTVEAVGADIALVIAGGRHALQAWLKYVAYAAY
jgi:hypothetical protein